MKATHWVVLSLAAVTVGCRKPAPQLPSNKRMENVAVLDMARVNREMVAREDSALTAFAAQHVPQLEKTADGFWYRIDRAGQGRQLRSEAECVIAYCLYSLEGALLEEERDRTVIVGRKEVIAGLDAALPLLRVGDEATFLFPWSLAYGLRGYGSIVPPYTSVMMTVQVVR